MCIKFHIEGLLQAAFGRLSEDHVTRQPQMKALEELRQGITGVLINLVGGDSDGDKWDSMESSYISESDNSMME